jgi:hypothetical protein
VALVSGCPLASYSRSPDPGAAHSGGGDLGEESGAAGITAAGKIWGRGEPGWRGLRPRRRGESGRGIAAMSGGAVVKRCGRPRYVLIE